jgi:rhamnose utilization protein RhaD (predicted bifunctional aldolase and dehydrogenase)/NAD(P)-dependent dehydrogenase (short-subunit alcohol dehydrogenase family)
VKSLWNDQDARAAGDDPVALRTYTSRLLGQAPDLVLHGGGNTSVKAPVTDFFGDEVEVLHVKGSGWDLATIEPAGFSPVRQDTLMRMADLDALTDTDMVREQRAALLNPYAPNPSVEAILHALIPFRYVDHTHTDAVVTVTNAPDGPERVRRLYGDRVLYVPYVMPGFVLAREVRRLTRDVDWSRYEGMVLLHHGLFTWSDDAREAYERMIALVTLAEEHLRAEGAWEAPARASAPLQAPPLKLARLRRAVSVAAKGAVVARFSGSEDAAGFAGRADVADLATRGPVTPDHVIRTKRTPVIFDADASADPDAAVAAYVEEYRAYFTRNDPGGLTCLEPSPRWGVWRDHGILAFGASAKAADQVADIARHTARCFQWGEALGGWTPLGEADIFEMEYWELEQAKLGKPTAGPPLQGKVALVTGAAGGIGRAIADKLRRDGAAVCVFDVSDAVLSFGGKADTLALVADATDSDAVRGVVEACVRQFGGLDILVSNAGNFPPSEALDAIDDASWQRCIDLNLTSHMKVLRAATPYLALGIDPAVVVVASKNVPAPGPGAAAYSSAKAALTQLSRVAALELATKGVRVNMLHPDKVFDTGLWSDEKIRLRAAHYGLDVERYKRSNLLGVEVLSADVAALAAAMAGPVFRTTTGAQVPVDGGNDRVI